MKTIEQAMEQAEEMGFTLEHPKSLGQIISRPPNGKPLPQESSTKSSEAKYSKEDKARFTVTIMQVFQMLKEYGKQGQDFDVIVQGFLLFFERKGYPMDRIIDALFIHLDRSKEIPTPMDIENIINPPPPKIDWPLYIELKKRLREGNVYVDQDERQFIRNCEDLAIIRQRGEMASYQEAQRQLQAHQQTMLSYDAN
jgi:hypothetical protein